MKKSVILLAALALVSTGCYAQKTQVRKAKNLALAETPDYAAARTAIAPALTDETTKDVVETWFIAGLIGYQQNYNEILKLQLNKGGKDNALRGKAVMESYDYWMVADSLSRVPVYDKKGKAKYDTKYRRQIADKMVEYYNHYELVNYGIDLFNAKDFAAAYEAFSRYVNLPELEMLQEKKYQEQMVRDENYYTYKYYTALAAYNSQQYDRAIPLLRTMLKDPANGVKAGQFLYQSYINKGDSVAANQALDECIDLFPAESWFIQNRINNLVSVNMMDEAIAYLNQAIAKDPQVQYFILKGSIQTQLNRFDDAIATYETAMKINDSDAALYENFGLVYSTKGNKIKDDATYLDDKAYKQAEIDAKNAFRDALPYFEKAYQLEPDNLEYKQNLRRLYYVVGDMDNYNKLQD